MRSMLVVLGIHDPMVLEGITDWAHGNSWDLDISCIRHGQSPPASGFDGVLATVNSMKLARWLSRLSCPVVRMLDPSFPQLNRTISKLPVVNYDAEAAGRLGAEHLLTVGRRNFVFCSLSTGADTVALSRGYIREIQNSGRKPVILNFAKDHPNHPRDIPPSRSLVRLWMMERLKTLHLPAAIMADDDRCALDLVASARQLGMAVPGDLAIVGCQNQQHLLATSTVELSSVDVNLRGVGSAAAEMLANLVEGGTPPAQPLLIRPSRVDARMSTSLYLGSNEAVRLAMDYIREHFTRRIRIRDVASYVGLTSRGIQRAVFKETGKTLLREITRLRLGEAMRLLTETNPRLQEIAKLNQLGDAKNLCRLFMKYHGISPRKWAKGASGRKGAARRRAIPKRS